MKRKRTLRERAQLFADRRPVPTDREIGLFYGWLAGYRAAKRERKK